MLPRTQSHARRPPSGNSSTTSTASSSAPFSASPFTFFSSPQREGAGEPTRVGASHASSSSFSRIDGGRVGQGVSPLRVRRDDRADDAGDVERLLEGEVEVEVEAR